jgi:hypothetical protein
MRRRIVWLVIGVLLWAGLGAGVYRYLTLNDIQLRVGIHEADIRFHAGPQWKEGHRIPTETGYDTYYCREPNWFGFYRAIRVHYDRGDRVTGWDEEVRYDDRQHPIKRLSAGEPSPGWSPAVRLCYG